MAQRFPALLLVALVILPFSAPFSTCALEELSTEHGSLFETAPHPSMLIPQAKSIAPDPGAIRRESVHLRIATQAQDAPGEPTISFVESGQPAEDGDWLRGSPIAARSFALRI